MGLLIFIVVGFGALSVDVSMMTMANLQAQATADAAAHAALIGFRENRSIADANSAAGFIMTQNRVAMAQATLDNVQMGQWDFDVRSFTPGLVGGDANAARAFVSRQGANAVPTLLAGILGVQDFDVDAHAVAAQQRRSIMLVLDMSCSMMTGDSNATGSPVAFLRQGTQVLFDYITARPQSGDRFGISLFSEFGAVTPPALGGTSCDPGNPFGCDEPWLPLTRLADAGAVATIQDRIDGICDTMDASGGQNYCNNTGAFKPSTADIGSCTAPHHAILQAYEELASLTTKGQKIILFMSDGLPNCGTQTQAVDAMELAAGIGVVAYTVTVTASMSDPALADALLVAAPGGFGQVTSDPAGLIDTFEEFAKRLPMVYTD